MLFMLHLQVFANFVKSPVAQSQRILGGVKLYFDPNGRESVADTLVKEGCNVSLADVEPSTSLKSIATVDNLSSSAMDHLRVREQPQCLSESPLKTLTVTDHTTLGSHPISRSDLRVGAVNTVQRMTVRDDSIRSTVSPMQAEVKNPALMIGRCLERTAAASGPRVRGISEHSSPEQDCRVTSTSSAHQRASPWKRLQQLYKQL